MLDIHGSRGRKILSLYAINNIKFLRSLTFGGLADSSRGLPAVFSCQ